MREPYLAQHGLKFLLLLKEHWWFLEIFLLGGFPPCPPTTCVTDKWSSPLLKSQDDDEVRVKKGKDQGNGAAPLEKHPEKGTPSWASGGAQGSPFLITPNLPVYKPCS